MNFHLNCSIVINVEIDPPTFNFLFGFYVDSLYRHEAEPGGFMHANQRLLQSGSSSVPFLLDQLRQAVAVLRDCYPGAAGAARAQVLMDELRYALNSAKEAQGLVNSSLVIKEFGMPTSVFV